MMSIVFALIAGITLTLQNSMNGLMTPRIGAMGTSLVGFTVQTIVVVACLLIKEHRLPSLRKVPPLCFAGGLMACMIVGGTGICVSMMGSAVTTCCSVAGQIIMSAMVDHFALLGTKRNPFSVKRIPGFVIIIVGVLLMNLLNGGNAGEVKLGYLALVLAFGAGSVIVRTVNYKAGIVLKSTLGGGLVNSMSGMVSALVLFFVLSGFKPDFSGFAAVPVTCYFAGCFGVACLLCNIMAYKRSNVFYATIFMLIGQVAASVVMDIFVFRSLSAGKCVGIAVVVAGVLLDKVLTRRKA